MREKKPTLSGIAVFKPCNSESPQKETPSQSGEVCFKATSS